MSAYLLETAKSRKMAGANYFLLSRTATLMHIAGHHWKTILDIDNDPAFTDASAWEAYDNMIIVKWGGPCRVANSVGLNPLHQKWREKAPILSLFSFHLRCWLTMRLSGTSQVRGWEKDYRTPQVQSRG